MHKKYEHKRENLWKEFDAGVKGRHISYFVQRANNEPTISGKVFTKPQVDYTMLIDLIKIETLLKKKMQYKRTWKPYEVYDFSALLHYIDQAHKEKCKKVLLSKKEYAMISASKK